MADATMGQRIAQRRKMLNLSQEAFGEKMGVSRQAISKWEADGAIPEIDKLIAMSKLFGVTVGWLLGTEEEMGQQSEAFSEAQLKMVEEIVKRYRQPEQKPRKRVPVWAGVLVLLLTGIIAAMMFGDYVNLQVSGIHSQIESLYSYYSSIDRQLGTVSQRLDELAAGERLLSEYALEVAPWEDLIGATIRFTAIPRTTQAGDQAWLSVRRNGEEVANAMCAMDGSAYTAAVELPAADGYSYYFQVIHVGGDSAQQALTEAYGCEDLESGLQGHFLMDFHEAEHKNGLMEVTGLELFYMEPKLVPDGGTVRFQEMTLLVQYGQESILRIPIVREGVVDADETYVKDVWDMTWFHYNIDVSFPCAFVEESEVTLSVEAVLSNGKTEEQSLVAWSSGTDGIHSQFFSPID